MQEQETCNTDPLEWTMEHIMDVHRNLDQQQAKGNGYQRAPYPRGVDNFSDSQDQSPEGIAAWPIANNGVDKSELQVDIDKSPIKVRSRSGRSHQVARDSADILSRAHAVGCTKRDRARLFDQFLALNFDHTRAAYISELRVTAYKRGFKNVETFVREGLRCDELGHSALDSHVLSMLGEWFSEPAIVENYDPESGILISSWRRWDIRKDIRLVLKTSTHDLTFANDDETQEEGLEREIARSHRANAEPISSECDIASVADVSANPGEAIINAANDLITSISRGTSKQAHGFQLLVKELDLLVTAGKLTQRDRSLFVVALTSDATTAGKAVQINSNAARQVLSRTRKKLFAACDIRLGELGQLKELLEALKDRSN